MSECFCFRLHPDEPCDADRLAEQHMAAMLGETKNAYVRLTSEELLAADKEPKPLVDSFIKCACGATANNHSVCCWWRQYARVHQPDHPGPLVPNALQLIQELCLEHTKDQIIKEMNAVSEELEKKNFDRATRDEVSIDLPHLPRDCREKITLLNNTTPQDIYDAHPARDLVAQLGATAETLFYMPENYSGALKAMQTTYISAYITVLMNTYPSASRTRALNGLIDSWALAQRAAITGT